MSPFLSSKIWQHLPQTTGQISHLSCNYQPALLVTAVAALTHWGRDKMDPSLQTTLGSIFSWMKMFEFQIKQFNWYCFFEHATSHYLNRWWFISRTHICVTRPQWVKTKLIYVAMAKWQTSAKEVRGSVYIYIYRYLTHTYDLYPFTWVSAVLNMMQELRKYLINLTNMERDNLTTLLIGWKVHQNRSQICHCSIITDILHWIILLIWIQLCTRYCIFITFSMLC